MLCIISDKTDPYLNLAAEEYFLKEFKEDIFMLWRSEPAVIVGKHQNTLAEINYNYVKKNNIKVARRLSGGGTVYHDLGNLNYTFIVNSKEGKLVNFYKHIEPVLKVLHNLSVNAEFEGKNNIVVNNRKVSGNAEHIYKKRVLHHGTLLFNTQLDNLNEAIRVLPGRYKDKAVQSNRDAVTNISEYLKSDMNILEFRNMLLKHIITNYYNSRIYEVKAKDLDGIRTLVKIKYSAWEWIYGYSPKYSLNCIYKTGKSEVIFRIFVENGIIKDLEVNRNNGSDKVLLILQGLFTGLPHRESDLREKTDKISELLAISRVEADKIVDSMF